MSFVRIEHPEAGEAEVSDRAVRHHEKRGWKPAGPATPVAVSEAEAPHKNASTADWQDYAKRRGLAPVVADGMSRDELVAFYTDNPQES